MSSISIEIFETPDNCFECPYRYKSEEMSLGNCIYQSLFRCRKEPEMDYEEQEDFDPYINDYIVNNQRAPWCTLRILTEEEERKLTEILGDVRTK